MEFLTEHNITAIIVMFLMVIEIQISKINIKIEELLKKKINQALCNT